MSTNIESSDRLSRRAKRKENKKKAEPIPEVKKQEVVPEAENLEQDSVVNEEEYQKFFITGSVSEETLNKIAEKIKSGSRMSLKEKTIYSVCGKEIEEILKQKRRGELTQKPANVEQKQESEEAKIENTLQTTQEDKNPQTQEVIVTKNQEEEIEPETPAEKEIIKEIENLSPEDKEKLGWGLSVIGYRVKKETSDFLGKSLNWAVTKAKINEKGTAGRFLKELRDSYLRDGEAAKKNILSAQKGDVKLAKTRSIGMLAGSVIKIGRTVADVTGISIANPMRYAMMGGMVTARMAEAGKEARFKNEELMEKTRIQDADLAAEEAWKIYEKSGGRITNDGARISNTTSKEAIEKAYIEEMPKDLQKRLEDPSVALSFVQKALRKNIDIRVSRLNTKIEEIENGSKNEDDKKIAKEKLFRSWEKELKDYDRMLTQYGTVDEIAMSAKYAQIAGKGVVLGMQIETALVSGEKLWSGVHNLMEAHGIHPIEATENFVKHIFQKKDGAQIDDKDSADYMKKQLGSLLHKMTPKGPGELAKTAIDSNNAENTINPDAIIHKGQGIEHALIRQIEHNSKMAQELGFKGNINDPKALHVFAQHQAHIVAIKEGYVDNAGHEVRITEGNKVGYELSFKDGHPVVIEKTIDGKILGTYDSENRYAFGKNPENPYEKEFTATHHETADHLAGNATQNSVSGTEENSRFFLNGHSNLSDRNSLNIDKFGVKDEGYFPKGHQLGENETVEQTMDDKTLYPGKVINQGDTQIRITNGDPKVGYNMTWGPRNIYEMGGNHAQNFPDLSPRDIDLLQHHPEIVGNNSFHLSGQELMKVYEVHRDNLAHVFPGEEIKDWQHIKGLKIKEMLDHKEFENNPEHHSAMIYIHKLIDTTGLKPKVGWFKPETAEQYVARALQKAAQEGKLEQVEMDYIK